MSDEYLAEGIRMQNEEVERLKRRIAELEDDRDQLMIEFCPDEMPQIQRESWAERQRLGATTNSKKISSKHIDMKTRLIELAQTHRELGLPLYIEEFASIAANIECKNMLNAAPAQQWIKCSERVPTEADADFYGEVWVFDSDGHVDTLPVNLFTKTSTAWVAWMPTGLTVPAPPEGE